MSVKPTPYEQQRAEDRRKQSDAEQQTLDAAIAACGPGAIRYGYWVLRDKTGKEP